MLDEHKLQRYRASLCLADFSATDQQLLADAHIAIVGLGGLGCCAALYLGASGVGSIELIDHDRVDISNLQRQIAYSESDLGRYKAEALQQRLQQLNSELLVTAHSCDFTSWPATKCDLVLDCSDNLKTRLQINAYCVSSTTSLLSAAALGYDGQLFVFNRYAQQRAPCYACAYRNPNEPADNCARAGIYPPLVGIVASWQATLALELLRRPQQHPRASVLSVSLPFEQQLFNLRADPNCPVCSASL